MEWESRVDFEAYSLGDDGLGYGWSRHEMDLLRYFIGRPGETLKRMKIMGEVWSPEDPATIRTVDNRVLRLRKKVESDPSNPTCQITVHRVGYRFVARGE